MKKILTVEDESSIREFVVINLKRAGYTVFEAGSGEEALELFEQHNGDFDVILLDVMLPGIDGFTVCKKIREQSGTMGIIMLSAKSQEMDKVSGLMLGADDYVTKPFSPSELVARVDAIHRRVVAAEKTSSADKLTSGPFALNLKSRTLEKNNVEIEITQVEYQLMELFMNNPNAALSRSEILSKVWGENYFGDEKIVDVNIRRLRVKLEEDPSKPQYLLTVWGFGYKWID
ncbi:MAG: response regulator transcription factor [Oscillospiraceae bacterium]|nr:response regulator transcription factor [Oscillospiraceae bacterium]MBQ3050235.1 response regulator transcription factor [Oscillospiraceae bacterium]MBQ9938130.1 response regulator transcription factor [Oscillospiraceae bacterium]